MMSVASSSARSAATPSSCRRRVICPVQRVKAAPARSSVADSVAPGSPASTATATIGHPARKSLADNCLRKPATMASSSATALSALPMRAAT
ncbi:hypothetical protein EB73_18685 [Mycobacterium sp. SWH-M3]|nr:hypothetical protein EB73_18685 [Mycobacterium sp. SWH-M3]